MNILGNNLQPISDDQELAKVLAGVSNQSDDSTNDFNMPTPAPAPAAPAEEQPTTAPEETTAPEAAPEPAPQPEPTTPAPVSGNSSLDSIKNEALHELRPLVDKLDVSAEEKFDTYLLLLRSTDDQELIAPAHEAARAISDEARRAQALLDIIKEIDYLSNKSQTA